MLSCALRDTIGTLVLLAKAPRHAMSVIPECLRMEAFHHTWFKIQATIDEVLRGINLKLFDQVLARLAGVYSGELNVNESKLERE
jgi:hypothetical protein